ncbi:cytochrome P450 oxidoreductase OrdA-like, putative [Rhizoctonia solani AG-1 IA]|uniref:Cytochrome P450 oxidoreductase OrdA-like, putative n=1 Tax=Thanatephorus cucumeris (strain AG1-IA) TaxID=983506 RepID=L8WMK9_THACA|nr:cytochrome P450 oxidoreductase OrdA-like, putative [Rhizoctonia solani AG-1 IA]
MLFGRNFASQNFYSNTLCPSSEYYTNATLTWFTSYSSFAKAVAYGRTSTKHVQQTSKLTILGYTRPRALPSCGYCREDFPIRPYVFFDLHSPAVPPCVHAMADAEKVLAGSLGALALVWLCHRTLHQQLPLPPGPSGHWIWGNVAEMNVPHRPVKAPNLGDIICLRTLSNTTVIINSEALATELLEKRAAETSDRPRNVFVRELMGWNTSTVLHTHNNRHRQLRKTMALVLQQSQARTYSTLHSSNLLQFLRALAKTPDNYMNHIDDSASRFIMNLAYGHEIIEDDPLVAAVRAGQIYMEDGLATHRWVNSLPFRKLNLQSALLPITEGPFQCVITPPGNQLVQPSFTSRLLEQKGGANASEEDVDLIKWSAASLFGAEQTKAQDEIDRVIGPNRLPTVHDRGSLPYVEAVLQEVMRYYPVVPLCAPTLNTLSIASDFSPGIPHSTEQDIEFQGYRIPKGSSIEAILHDPDIYSDPHVFRPERYLESKPAPDPRKYIFGFGRRICPGIHIAYDSTFINCAGLISVFDFRASAELLASVDAVGGLESPDMWKLFNSSKIVPSDVQSNFGMMLQNVYSKLL